VISYFYTVFCFGHTCYIKLTTLSFSVHSKLSNRWWIQAWVDRATPIDQNRGWSTPARSSHIILHTDTLDTWSADIRYRSIRY